MKAIPFICSRTKEQDFVADYLVRPDFDWRKAKPMVANIINGLDDLEELRYAVFETEGYCIFGIGCLSRLLASETNTREEYQQYLKDRNKRSIACFIGFALKIDIAASGMPDKVPDMVSPEFLKLCCDTYFKHLSRQWTNWEVVSEVISIDSDDTVDLPEKLMSYADLQPPAPDYTLGEIQIFKEFKKEWLYYYLDQIIYQKNSKADFISRIYYESEWQKLCFHHASVSQSLFSTLPAIQKRNEEKAAAAVLADLTGTYQRNIQIWKDFLEKGNFDNRFKYAREKIEEVKTYIQDANFEKLNITWSQLNNLGLDKTHFPEYSQFYENIKEVHEKLDSLSESAAKRQAESYLQSIESLLDTLQNKYNEWKQILSDISKLGKDVSRLSENQQKVDSLKNRLKDCQQRIERIQNQKFDSTFKEQLNQISSELQDLQKQILNTEITENKFRLTLESLKREINQTIQKIADIISSKEKEKSKQTEIFQEAAVLSKTARFGSGYVKETLQKTLGELIRQECNGIQELSFNSQDGYYQIIIFQDCKWYRQVLDMFRLMDDLSKNESLISSISNKLDNSIKFSYSSYSENSMMIKIPWNDAESFHRAKGGKI